MKIATKIVFASALTLSAIAPTFVSMPLICKTRVKSVRRARLCKVQWTRVLVWSAGSTQWPMCQPTSATGTHATLE